MDRPGVRQVPDCSGEQRKMEETGCETICGAPMTIVVKELRMMKVISEIIVRWFIAWKKAMFKKNVHIAWSNNFWKLCDFLFNLCVCILRIVSLGTTEGFLFFLCVYVCLCVCVCVCARVCVKRQTYKR